MKKYWHDAIDWLWQTPERSLNAAYNAALEIERIENEYLRGGQVLSLDDYSDNVVNYIDSELSKYLQIAQTRLSEFKLSRSILNLFIINVFSNTKNSNISELEQEDIIDNRQTIEVKTVTYKIIEKLNFVEEILIKYKFSNSKNKVKCNLISQTSETASDTSLIQLGEQISMKKTQALQNKFNKLISAKKSASRTSLDEPSVIPRSIGRTIEKLKRDLNPNAETEVIQEFRRSRYRTIVSIRYLLILVLVPFLMNQLAKGIIISPLVNSFWNNNQSNIYLNSSQEERAFTELKSFEEKLKFDFLAGKSLAFTPEITETKLKQKASELAQKYKLESNNALKSIFADLLSVATFVALLVIGKRQIAIFKSFIDEIVYGLSDSAKAFLIILLTDLFVGFHSSHGWEVILENTLKHFGLPENKDFVFMFIATFPVVLDVIFKYWIFRYLNRISPSAVATYRNMNE
ncbi:proton extrusion protein PcxA [Chroococcidiopsis thermalis]|uniref:Proton extrusion protein PxcA n=1 Tax=Chroococcidiopsis thermalis (strain PCC 7203) TaxID=251229 RepID=K9U896_CHRTP|nr:proton extrusion protein PcxA [Chroococcidiopsis thermalis]AFY91070.1 CemA family protein [Chroococcidiopsis thermalis PCC 7203]